jgi:hypothetical protein
MQATDRVGNLTDEFPYSRWVIQRDDLQAPATRELSATAGATPDLARLLRKHPGERSHTMIAATAFAVVGLVVVAFLNRIP